MGVLYRCQLRLKTSRLSLSHESLIHVSEPKTSFHLVNLVIILWLWKLHIEDFSFCLCLECSCDLVGMLKTLIIECFDSAADNWLLVSL